MHSEDDEAQALHLPFCSHRNETIDKMKRLDAEIRDAGIFSLIV
jgi:endogenous inhibitor of DNA gyrase (YacG/DUF329 family)